jgi:pimeloyl-ACP methyl ester carboxylesterase
MVSHPDWRGEYPFASTWESVGPHRQHVIDEGPRDAPVMLFVHGNPTWSFYWRHLIAAFRDEARCVAPDHLGMGLSDKPQDGPYRLEDRIRDLVALIERRDLRDITLVVHDWGGAIGLGAAGRLPERFRRLVITNTGAFPSPHMPRRIAACRVPLVGPLAVRGLNGFAGAAVFMATENGLSPVARAGLLAPYGSWHDRVAIQRFVEDIPMDASHPSWQTLVGVEAGLARLAHLPVLLAWGERDWCFTPAFRRQFLQHFPDAVERVHPEAGHYLCEDAREALEADIRAFRGTQPA